MSHSRKQLVSVRGNRSFYRGTNKRCDARAKLRYELLEPRMMLASDLDIDDFAGVQTSAAHEQPILTLSPEGSTPTSAGVQASAAQEQSSTAQSPEGSTQTSAPITWFESFNSVPRIAFESLAVVDRLLAPEVAGPVEPSVGEWIVQLTDDATRSLRRVNDVTGILSNDTASFQVISGLGNEGLLLVRGTGVSRAEIEASLTANPNVERFSLNQLITGQATTPNDTDFVRGAMPSLTTIGLPNAWDEMIGSLTTVVGVLDTGIDLAHRDLYLNIWFNQGEIPVRSLDSDGNKLVDIDNDGLITFYDLNNVTRATTAPFSLIFGGIGIELNPNAEFVQDFNGNGYIDGLDILADPLWADGRDTDGNGEVDDFFGVNFRGDGVRNIPNDGQGHGTHVSGTIGAIGGNSFGVTGINWSTSLMSLRILDNNLQGDTGSAIQAVNYARRMREQYRVDDFGRVVTGANIRVLNNSWGQPGGFESALATAITESGDAGILFVSAAGNGNFLGQSVDNDRTPFYPASYEASNIIAVAASDANDRLAPFSNFGRQSVDIAAPGIGIRSTEAGGGFGTRNGTSMATPHVAGTAALIWSALPAATVEEVRAAIITSIVEVTALDGVVATGGRMDASGAIFADVFAPSARLVTAENITTAGGTTAEFTVEYFHRSGFTQPAIEQTQLLITRQWGYGDQLTPRLKPGSVSTNGSTAQATYIVDAPGSMWDKLDFGDYEIETVAGSGTAIDGTAINQQAIGAFNVTISPQSDPSVIYVNTFNDQIGKGSLRDAILAANRRGGESTLILNAGTYLLEIPPVIDPDASFPPIVDANQLVVTETIGSNATTGDFIIESNITVIGSQNLDTLIDAQELDRIFRVTPDGKLTLRNLTLQNGVSSGVGGAILVFGDVETDLVIVRDSRAVVGSGIASLGGHTQIERTRITDNASQFAAIYIAGDASANVTRSTIDNNDGGGLQSLSRGDVTIHTSTISANRRGVGAVASGFAGVSGASSAPSLSADGRFVTFESSASNLVPGDNNNQRDIFVYDRQEQRTERVSVNDAGEEANSFSSSPSLSSDGRFVTFMSFASNLVPGGGGAFDIFVFDRQERRIERVSINDAGEEANSGSDNPSLSADGRFVTFESDARNLVPGDTNNLEDIFVYDRQARRIERVSTFLPKVVVTSGTLIDNEATRTLFGQVEISNSLFGGNIVSTEADTSVETQSFNTRLNDVQRQLVGPLKSDTFLPPTHRLLFGNPAIDKGNPTLAGVADQNNTLRGVPDVGAVEASRGIIRGLTFADLNQNASRDIGEPIVKIGVIELTRVNRSETLMLSVNGSGTFQTLPLEPGEYRLMAEPLTSWTPTSLPIELIRGETAASNQSSLVPSLSADGRFVSFESGASNLVPGDNNNRSDIFVYDRQEQRIERVNVNEAGEEANNSSSRPSLSTDGRFVTFASEASNLVPGDNSNSPDIFVYDRREQRIERVSVNDAGVEANSSSSAPSLSVDGRFVTFESRASNLVPGDNNNQRDIFVYDRQERRIERVSINDAGEEANNSGSFSPGSFSPSLSADGRFVTFESDASNLVRGDANGFFDIFVVPNPFLPPSLSVTLRAGETIDHIEIPFTPNPGAISGRVFFDTAVLNGAFDLGEEILVNHPVFLDTNGNGLLDSDEPRTFIDTEGRYQFDDVPAFRNQVIVVAAPNGFEQVVPEREDQPGFTVFLPAGGNLNGIDFGFRPITTTGQSSDSTIRGRLLVDTDGDGVGDQPVAGKVVYLDSRTLGVRDFDDPQAVTDADGYYTFTGLPATVTPVRVVLDENVDQVSPLGSQFSLQKFSLSDKEKREGNPQAVVTADFNRDGFQDVAVVLAETNTLSIRLNDQQGGFLPRMVDLKLSDLVGSVNSFLQPTSIVVGSFDSNLGVDVALTGNFSQNVLVLRNFDAESGDFASWQLIPVGSEPLDLVKGQFAGDASEDLVVLTKTESKLQVLVNQAGVFTAGPGIDTGGVLPASIASADFTRDGDLDIAVTHTILSTSDITRGRVTLLTGNGVGGLALSDVAYTVQASPTDSAVGDFNGDGRPDLSVVNFQSNSISVLIGQADGTLRVQSSTLGTTQGAVDIAVADIDNDGDDDILASKLQRREVAIFRNIGSDPVTGEVRFEPQESIGLGQFSFAERAPFAIANLDNDTSGPNGSGSLDIVAVPQNTDTLHVLKNSFVQGSRRASVSGARTDVADSNDFVLRPAILQPSFNAISTSIQILEDAGQQIVSIPGIVKGRATGPDLQIFVTSDNPQLIPSPGMLSYNGSETTSFTFMPLPDANQTAVLHVRAVDAGADQLFDTSDDGVFERSITVTVMGVNDPPSFSIPAEISRLQKSGLQTLPDFVTELSPSGSDDEEAQTLIPFTLSTDASFFTSQPSIDSEGILSFAINPEKSGIVQVTVSVTDSGGLTNGGRDTTTKTFAINVIPVNDQPSITIGSNQTVRADEGPQTITNFATGFAPGGGSDETTQTISDFIVTVDSPGLFSVLPDVDNTGTLTFTPAIDRAGSATVGVQVRDSGGSDNDGDDLSAMQTFTINVTTIPDSVKPSVVLETSLENDSTRSQQQVLVVFSRDVIGLTPDDFQLTNATVVALNGSGSRYTLTLDASFPGEFTVRLPDDRVADSQNLRNTISNTAILNFAAATELLLDSENETVDLSTVPEVQLRSLQRIDIRGTGRNSLVLDAAKIAALTPNKTLVVIADQGDTIAFGDGWQFETVEPVNGQLHRIFTNGTAILRVVGPLDWTNPLITGDVNGSGDVTAGDALDVLFSLRQSQLFDAQGILVDAATVAPSEFRFYDTNGDGTSTAADALFIINILFLQSFEGSGESEALFAPSALLVQRSVDEKVGNRADDEPRVLEMSENVTAGPFVGLQVPNLANVIEHTPSNDSSDELDKFAEFDATLAAVMNWFEL